MFEIENNNTAPSLSVLVQSDRLQLLYRQSFPAIFASIIAAAILTVTLWPAQEHSILLGWFCLLLITAMARLYLFSRYHKLLPEGQDILSWEKPYFITLMLTSITWGFGALLIMPVDSQVYQAVVYCFLIGLSGGAISLYSSHSDMTLATITVVLIPATIFFIINGSYVFVGMTVGGIIFFFSAIRATKFIGHTLQQNFIMTRQLELSSKESERLARFDDLTGLYNRRAFYEYGKLLANNCQRNKDHISMIHMDIDNFKIINDTFGHVAGDAVLRKIGAILLQRLRKTDIFARIGGEEFGMLLPMTSLEQAAQIAEELRLLIAQTSFSIENENFTVTASFGVASDEYDIDALVKQSDGVMYQSKESGRNTVMCYQE